MYERLLLLLLLLSLVSLLLYVWVGVNGEKERLFTIKICTPTVSLHEEVCDFLKYIDPTVEEIAMRRDVVQRIAHTVYSLWPKAKVFYSYFSCH